MAFSGFDSGVTPAFSPAQGSSSFKDNFYSTDLSPEEQLIIAKGLSLEKGNESAAGPRGIGEYGDVGEAVDDGNCFYDAVFKQMSQEQQQTVSSYSALRQRIDPGSTKEKWADTPQVRQFARQFNCVVAIVDTRYPRLGFHIYYVNEQGIDSDSHNPKDVPNQPIFRLAYNGNHYMPVESHVAFGQGAIQKAWSALVLAVNQSGLQNPASVSSSMFRNSKPSSPVVSPSSPPYDEELLGPKDDEESSSSSQPRSESPSNQAEFSSSSSSSSQATTSSSSEFNMQQFASETVKEGTFIRNLKGNINLRNTNAPKLPVGLGVDKATGDINVGDSVASSGAQLNVSTSQSSIETTVNINNFHGSLNAGSGSQQQPALMLNPDRVKEICFKLQAIYRNQLKLKRISDGQEFELHDKYINVAIIKEEEHRKQEEKLKFGKESELKEAPNKDRLDIENRTNPSRLPPNFEALRQVKEPVELVSLYADATKAKEQFQGEKQHLILGRAGIGKTTLCQYIVAKHACGELWNDKFDWAFWVPLRLLRHYANQSDVPLWQVLHKTTWEGLGLTEEEAESFWETIKAESEKRKVLWLLDGYDEIVNLANNKTIKPLLAELRKASCYILTSRPYGVEQLNCKSRLETIGFIDEAINEYVSRYFDVPEHSSSMLKLLKQDQRLRSLMSIPINADLICGLHSKNIVLSRLSMTGLYSNLVDTLLVRSPDDKYIGDEAEKKAKEATKTLSRKKAKPLEADKDMIKFLSQLAWNNLGDTDNSIIITEQQRERALAQIKIKDEDTQLEMLDKAFDSGLLKRIGTLNEIRFKKDSQLAKLVYTGDCYFIHLTFQDFFAAQYVVSVLLDGSAEEQKAMKEAIRQNKYNPYYYFVWAFLAGLLKDSRNENISAALTDFFELLLKEPQDVVGIYELGVLMQCVEECLEEEGTKNQLQEKRVKQLGEQGALILDKIEKWVLAVLERQDNRRLMSWLTIQLPLIPHLVSSGFLHSIALKKLDKKESLNVQSAAVEALKQWGRPDNIILVERVFKTLFEAANHKRDIKTMATEALRQWSWPSDAALAEKIFKIIQEVVTHNQDSNLQPTALAALQQWGWPSDVALAEKVFKIIREVVTHNEDYYVLSKALSTLGQWGKPDDIALAREAFRMLLEVANWQHPERRYMALYAFGKWGWPSEVGLGQRALDIFYDTVVVYGTRHSDMKCMAVFALGQWGWPSSDANLAKQALDILDNAVHSQSPIVQNVQHGALRALYEWGCWPAEYLNLTQQAFEVLRKVVRSQYPDIQLRGVYILSKWGRPSSDANLAKQALDVLREVANSRCSEVQRAALFVLDSWGSPSDATVVQRNLDTSCELVCSPTEDVQRAAVDTDILQMLHEVANNQDKVQRAAVETLGQKGWPTDCSQAQQALGVLREVANRQGYNAPCAVVEVLGRWGWPSDANLAKQAFKIFRKAANTQGYNACCAVVVALSNWGWPADLNLVKLMFKFLMERKDDWHPDYKIPSLFDYNWDYKIQLLFERITLTALLEQKTWLDNTDENCKIYCKMVFDKAISLNKAIYVYQDRHSSQKEGSYTLYYYEQNQQRQQSLTAKQFQHLEQHLATLNPAMTNLFSMSLDSSSSSSSVFPSSSSSDVVRMDRQDEVDQIIELLKQYKCELERDGLLPNAGDNQGMLYYLMDDEGGTSNEKIYRNFFAQGKTVEDVRKLVEEEKQSKLSQRSPHPSGESSSYLAQCDEESGSALTSGGGGTALHQPKPIPSPSPSSGSGDTQSPADIPVSFNENTDANPVQPMPYY